VMSGGYATTPRHPFMEARALLLAERLSGMSSPFRWAEHRGVEGISDIEYALRRLQSAHDRSVGAFSRVIEELQAQAIAAHTSGI
jgi:hypothetical protein